MAVFADAERWVLGQQGGESGMRTGHTAGKREFSRLGMAVKAPSLHTGLAGPGQMLQATVTGQAWDSAGEGCGVQMARERRGTRQSVHSHTKRPPSPALGLRKRGRGLALASRWRCRTARRPGASGCDGAWREDPPAVACVLVGTVLRATPRRGGVALPWEEFPGGWLLCPLYLLPGWSPDAGRGPV